MIETYNVNYSPQALEDLRDIYSYIAFELLVPDTAKNQVNRIRKEIRSLDFMPSRFSIVDWEPWKSMEMHKLPIDILHLARFITNLKSISSLLTVNVIKKKNTMPTLS